jgi:hypothetical protein
MADCPCLHCRIMAAIDAYLVDCPLTTLGEVQNGLVLAHATWTSPAALAALRARNETARHLS